MRLHPTTGLITVARRRVDRKSPDFSVAAPRFLICGAMTHMLFRTEGLAPTSLTLSLNCPKLQSRDEKLSWRGSPPLLFCCIHDVKEKLHLKLQPRVIRTAYLTH